MFTKGPGVDATYLPGVRTIIHSAQVEIGELREDIAPSWLRPPLSVEATAERYVRPHLRQVSGGGRAGQQECNHAIIH